MIAAVKSGRYWGGPCTGRFERELAKYMGVKRAIFCNSGSSALMLALSSMHIPKDSYVVTQALAFPTAISAIIQNGLKPAYIDVELDSLCVNPASVVEAVEKSGAKAYLHTHTIGNCPDMRKLSETMNGLENLPWIEDNCDSFGSRFNGKFLGAYADISCTSFHPAHQMTTGIGGACFTSSANYAERMLMLRDWGRINQIGLKDRFINEHDMRYFYPERGFNFQASEVMAAMGRIQLTKVDEFNKIRRRNFKMLKDFFSKHADLFIVPKEHLGAEVAWFGYPVIRNPNAWKDAPNKTWREMLMTKLEEKGIQCRSIYGGAITRQPGYQYVDYMQVGNLENSKYLSNNAFWISCWHGLSEEQVKQMCERIEGILNA